MGPPTGCRPLDESGTPLCDGEAHFDASLDVALDPSGRYAVPPGHDPFAGGVFPR